MKYFDRIIQKTKVYRELEQKKNFDQGEIYKVANIFMRSKWTHRLVLNKGGEYDIFPMIRDGKLGIGVEAVR